MSAGPTGLWRTHLGHADGSDILTYSLKLLKHLGYKVSAMVGNIPTSGHLEHDADEGARTKSQKKARASKAGAYGSRPGMYPPLS